MTKKSYIEFAQMIKELNDMPNMDKNTLKVVMYCLVAIFKKDNSSFNMEKFVSACNMKMEE